MDEWITYKRIPRVRRLEYLKDFLQTVEKGYTFESAQNNIQKVKLGFEEAKAKALGKSKKFKEVKGKHLTINCQQLSLQLNLVKKEGNTFILDPDAKKILSLGFDHPEIRNLMIERILQIYPSFRDLLFKIRNQKEGKINLPMKRDGELFRKEAGQYDISVDQLTFEIIRDLGTQLELLNWRLKMEEGREQSVYLITSIVKVSELLGTKVSDFSSFANSCVVEFVKSLQLVEERYKTEELLKRAKEKDCMIVKIPDDFVLIKYFELKESEFEHVLWQEYLKMTDYTPRFPIFYPELRDRVCETLRISDYTFSDMVKRMIMTPARYSLKVYPGGGILPYHPSTSYILKSLPPKTGSDEFIVYLKIDKPG